MIDITFKGMIKLLFGLSGIFFIYIWGIKFGLGLIYGMAMLSYVFLFPSPMMVNLLDKTFGYSKSMTVKMKNDAENQTKGFNVKFKK